jgi:hypothetical protein
MIMIMIMIMIIIITITTITITTAIIIFVRTNVIYNIQRLGLSFINDIRWRIKVLFLHCNNYTIRNTDCNLNYNKKIKYILPVENL